MLGDGSAFRGLYEDPAIPLERHLERLTAAASRKGLEGDIALDARPHTAAPGDGGLGVGEGRGRGVEEDGLTVRGDGDLTRSFEDDVEEAACEPAPSTRFMSQLIPGSKARMLSPLTVIRSLWRSSIMILRLSSARKRSPVPLAAISLTPSPVTAFLKKRPRPPLLCSKRTSPW